DEFPDLELLKVRNHTFLKYILSGGLTYKPLLSENLADFKNKIIDLFEAIFFPFTNFLSTHMDIYIKKKV
ncbi:MAG: hypothetical protein KKD35_05910, partial [Elusimicrobia bacterium]|nr:hypothetical protein [Elusimicrobiota bacterium]